MTDGSQFRRPAPTLCAILIAFVTGFGTPQAADAATIAIEWDRSPDPTVIGYQVSVGTAPGVYTETFDVGPATSFAYQAQDSRVYYLAVASYAAGPRVGPLSAAVASVSPQDARSFYETLWRGSATASARGPAAGRALAVGIPGRPVGDIVATPVPSTVCWTVVGGCLSVRIVTRRSAEITSLAASADNRLFFIEGGRRIGVVASGVVQPRPVLVSNSTSVYFEQVNLDPAFAITGLVYVGETETYADGHREFRVVQYRVVKNRAGARTVVNAVRLPISRRPTFTVSSGGYVFVTVPIDDPTGRRGGRVLSFSTDGSVPVADTGVGTGSAAPTASAFEESAQRLWIAGIDENDQASVATQGGPLTPAGAPVTSLSTATDGWGRTSLFATSASGTLGTARVQPDGTLTDVGELRIGSSLARTATAAPSGDLFVAVEHASSPAETSFSILRLTPLR